jgi:hypothetical protein
MGKQPVNKAIIELPSGKQILDRDLIFLGFSLQGIRTFPAKLDSYNIWFQIPDDRLNPGNTLLRNVSCAYEHDS